MKAKKPGNYYTWMFYLRRGLFNPDFMNALSQMFIYKIERIDPKFNFQLSGIETAATPMLAGIPIIAKYMKINLNAFVVRKERKEYGLENIIEGVPNDKPVLMLDDLCNSSESLAKCRNILIQEGHKIYPYAFTIVNKSNRDVHSEERQNSDLYLPKDIKVISLFTLDDFGLNNPSH